MHHEKPQVTPKVEELLALRAIKNIVFSEGTYQVQLIDPHTQEEFWPFLQLDDDGHVIDNFCNCAIGSMCDHVGAAYHFLSGDDQIPYHVHFRDSMWNMLCRMASRRHGYDEDVLLEHNGDFHIDTTAGKRVFTLAPLRRRGEEFVKEFITDREEETEESSLKFSNLPHDELMLYREGNPSHPLQYELSFWSDIAKYLFFRQKMGDKYSFRFRKEEGRFKYVDIAFPDFELTFFIAEPNWNTLIPALATIQSQYAYHETAHVEMDNIFYDEGSGSLRLQSHKGGADVDTGHLEEEYGKYSFVAGEGFYPKKADPLLNKKVIEPRFIHHFLDTHRSLVEKHIQNTRIHPGKYDPKYSLYFDSKDALHINMYLFEEGDLSTPNAKKFGDWVYVEEKGFYSLEETEFSDIRTIVPKEKVPEFITVKRAWLNQYKGFETHLSNVETKIVYEVVRKKTLQFRSETSFIGEGAGIIDLGSWIYVKEKGFYSKQLGRSHAFLSNGHAVPAHEISDFIDSHRDELESVHNFFAAECPIDKAGIDIKLNKDDLIEITPRLSINSQYKKSQVAIFGKYAYVQDVGFSELPQKWRLPAKYGTKQTIDARSEAFFVTCELAKIKPQVLNLDKRLTAPKKLKLKIKKLARSKGQWDVVLYYESELGTIDLSDLIKGFHEDKKGYLKTKAGLIFTKDIRFDWIRSLEDSSVLSSGAVRLNTLQWIRLATTENVKPPKGHDEDSVEASKLFKELQAMQATVDPDVTLLQSSLRPYQEMGVKWLYFLYQNGLSGLLCDEMGLGKTHQAMALLAASHAESTKKKYLVICPTSVLFHWEDLLKEFLPSLRVLVFYGSTRSLKGFKNDYDLLLTSYGTLRTEKSGVERQTFDIAVFDEIQVAKNHLSQTHKMLSKIKASMRLGLTGTPIENRLTELKALFDVVLPGYFPGQNQYRDIFVTPIEKENDKEAAKLLTKMIQPFLLRRKKTEVLKDLPEKIEEISHCGLSDLQKELYKEVVSDETESVKEELRQGSSMHVFALLTKLKRICNHPALEVGKPHEYHKYKSGKWELFTELLSEIRDSGQKVVVFSQYLEMLDIIERYLEDNSIKFAGIRGSTRDRREQIEKFKTDPKCEVFVASLKAVGVGVDLVSASVVIHYDRWWNPAVEDQATDRVHRFGQTRGVQVFKLVSRGTVEEHIDQLIKKKVHLTRGVLSYDEHESVKQFSKEDLAELITMIEQDISQ